MPLHRRPELSVEALLGLGVAYLLLAFNGAFWRAALQARSWQEPATWLFAGCALAVLAGAYFLVLSLLAARRTVRPLLAVCFVASAALAWYIDRFSVYVDRSMVRNVLATQWSEARELLQPDLALQVLLWGGVPALLLWWPRVERRGWGRAWRRRAAWSGLAAGLVLVGMGTAFADIASLMRNHREVRHLITPGNAVAATAGVVLGGGPRAAGPRLAVGPDARLGGSWARRQRPVLFVLVVGETARAANFSLNGYARPTTPELARRDVINFPDATACGTSTEVSLPCMFSPFGRRHYDEKAIVSHESLLHVLDRAGIPVRWRDNQSGCKGVCEGLPAESLDQSKVEALCPEGRCYDEILLHGLDRVVQDARGNVFVVLHQLGSHGPAYFRRYPATFKRFSPACETEDLHRCSAEEIRNAYDNTIAYTDHVLARVIDFLAARQDRYDTAMLYLSDHGESLGESGLYLHGIPYAIAPEVQRHVPMVAWLSEGFTRSFGVDLACVRARAGDTVSHDHLFHSVLGLLDVRTGAYEAGMDLFAPCQLRPAQVPAPARMLPVESRH